MAPKKVAVILDKERHLVANLNTLHAFKERKGKNLWECSMFEKGAKPDIEDIQAMAWAFLSDEDPALTFEDVGRIMGFGDLVAITAKCLEAFSINSPEPKEQPKNAPESTPGTG